jgi:hypothetical protein
MSTLPQKEGNIMDTNNVPTVTELPTEIPVPEKKKFYRNPKVIAGVVAGIIATGAAVVITSLRKDDSDSEAETSDEDDMIVEIFEETETPTLD